VATYNNETSLPLPMLSVYPKEASWVRYYIRYTQPISLATGALCYVSNRQIHEDLGVPLFTDLIRALTASFDSKLADVGNPLVRQLGRYLR